MVVSPRDAGVGRQVAGRLETTQHDCLRTVWVGHGGAHRVRPSGRPRQIVNLRECLNQAPGGAFLSTVRWQGMLFAALAGCGPNVSEEPLDAPEVCGARGPVRLVEAEVASSAHGGALWGSARVGERRVAAWFDDTAREGGDLSTVFGAYVVDACGGNEIALGERDYPLVLGDAAFVCDPLDGSIRALDVDTGEAGEALGSGFDCTPWVRRASALVMRNWDANVFGLLRADGIQLLSTSLPEFHWETNTFPLAPYLARWWWSAAYLDGEAEAYLSWPHQDRRTALELATGKVHELPERTEWVFGLSDGRDIWAFLEPDADGIRQTYRLETVGAEPQPGPSFDDIVQSIWSAESELPALLREDSILLVESGESVPRPGFLDPAAFLLTRLDADLFSQQTAEEVVVWDVRSGDVLVQFEPPGERCRNAQMVPALDALVGEFSDDQCQTQTRWILPLDGSAPWMVGGDPSDRRLGFLPGGRFVLSWPEDPDSGDLSVVELGSGRSLQLAPDIDGLAFPPHASLPRRFPSGDGEIEFFVREGDRAGLWLVGVPE